MTPDRRTFLAASAALAATRPAPSVDDPAPNPWALPPGVARLGRPEFRHARPVQLLAFAPDGKRLLAADGRRYSVWDVATGRLAARFPAPDGGYVAHHFPGDGTVELFHQGPRFARYDLDGGAELAPRAPALPPAQHATFAPDGRAVALVRPRSVDLHDAESGRRLWRFPRPTGDDDGTVEFSPDGRFVAVPAPGRFILLDAASGSPVMTLRGRAEETPDAALFTADGAWLVAVAVNWPGLTAWRLSDGVRVSWANPEPGHRPMVGPEPGAVRFVSGRRGRYEFFQTDLPSEDWKPWDTPLGRLLVAGPEILRAPSRDRRVVATAFGAVVQLWDGATGKPLLQSPEDVAGVRTMREGFPNLLLTSDDGNAWRCWDPRTGAVRGVPKGEDDAPAEAPMALAPDLSSHVAGLGPEGLRVVRPGLPDRTLAAPDGWSLTDVVFFPDDGRFLVAVADGGVVRWEVATGRREAVPIPPPGDLRGVAVDRRGDVAAAGYETSQESWVAAVTRPAEGREVRRVAFDGACCAFDVSPDGAALMALSARTFADDEEVRDEVGERLVLEFLTGPGWSRRQEVPFGRTGESPARNAAVSFAPDGRTLAGAVGDAAVGWEVLTGGRRWKLPHEGDVTALAFLGRWRLATAAPEGPLFVWDLLDPAAPHLPPPPAALRAALGSADAAAGFAAVRALATAPAKGVAWLRAEVPPARPADPKRVRELAREFDAPTLGRRERAGAELAKLADRARPLLRELLAKAATPEAASRLAEALRRADRVDEEGRRGVRGAEVLEACGTPEALELLGAWARGAEGARQTEEAKASLRRLGG